MGDADGRHRAGARLRDEPLRPDDHARPVDRGRRRDPAFLSSIIGWLGVAVTGSDTRSNSLFGALQVSAAKEAGARSDAARGGELLRRRARQDDLAAEPRDRRGGGRNGRSGGRALPARARMEHPAGADHVRARLPAVDVGAVVDGRRSSWSRPDLTPLVAELREISRRRAGATRRAPAADLRVRRAAAVLARCPAVAVLPGSAEQVQARRARVRRRGVPWVARGSGSGLSGGALPVEDGVLIVTSRMKRVLEVDLANQRVCVEPGVTNIAVSRAVAPDFFYPPDPSADRLLDRRQRGRELRRRALLQVRLHDELRLRARGRARRRRAGPARRPGARPPGYDLLGAFVGSEGTLGDRDQGLAARDARAGDGADARRLLRLHARGRRGGLGDRAGRRSCRARSR